MTDARQLEILRQLCDLPTAPYCEQHVIAWLLAWAKERGGKHVRARRDGAGNVHLEYRRGRAVGGAKKLPLVIEAHMDHPGFVLARQGRDGRIEAEFRGGVRPSHFAGATAKFWVNDPVAVGKVEPVIAQGHWVKARVERVKQIKGRQFMTVHLKLVKATERLMPGTLGMWDLPEAEVGPKKGEGCGQIFAARVCDDLAGVAAIVCLLEELIEQGVDGHVIGLCTRAEEVGFAGVLAVCEKGWIPRGASVIGLETSKASPEVAGAGAASGGVQGHGPIIRVGDRTGIFSAGLTHFLTQAAGHIADDDSTFKYQRRLMDGGTCNSTAFMAWDFDSAGMCVALGNYHNQTIKGDVGWKAGVGGTTGKGIASETIHLRDFAGMVRILVETVKRIGKYRRGFGAIRERFAKMHREQQAELLYATSDIKKVGLGRKSV